PNSHCPKAEACHEHDWDRVHEHHSGRGPGQIQERRLPPASMSLAPARLRKAVCRRLGPCGPRTSVAFGAASSRRSIDIVPGAAGARESTAIRVTGELKEELFRIPECAY